MSSANWPLAVYFSILMYAETYLKLLLHLHYIFSFTNTTIAQVMPV